jgi:hypothetical protein
MALELPPEVQALSVASAADLPDDAGDELAMLDADALLASALVQASTGYSAAKIRAMSLLRHRSPRLFLAMYPLITKYQLNMSAGAARNITKTIEARAMREAQMQLKGRDQKLGS